MARVGVSCPGCPSSSSSSSSCMHSQFLCVFFCHHHRGPSSTIHSGERRKIAVKARRFLLFLLPLLPHRPSPAGISSGRVQSYNCFQKLCVRLGRETKKLQEWICTRLGLTRRPELHVNLIKKILFLVDFPPRILSFINCHCFCTVIVTFFFVFFFFLRLVFAALCALSYCATQCSFFVFIHRDKVGRQPRMEVVIVSTLCGAIRRSVGKYCMLLVTLVSSLL